PQTVVGFANTEKPSTSSSSYRTSKLLQSSRALPSEEASSSSSLKKIIPSLQAQFAEYQHVRKQRKLQSEDEASSKNMLVQGFVPVVKQFLYAPNKMLLQSHVLAYQQAQYDSSHAYHGPALKADVTTTTTTSSSADDDDEESLSLGQRFAQSRREAKNARLAAKYAAIESLEDRAFQICKDLKMI
ncbi:MAG: hypothetical protein SGBAC_010924, partial [Bacillariaceae sp.]